MIELVATLFGGALLSVAGFIAVQVWKGNETLTEIKVHNKHRDIHIDNVRKRTHEHANVLQEHEGRLTTIEDKIS